MVLVQALLRALRSCEDLCGSYKEDSILSIFPRTVAGSCNCDNHVFLHSSEDAAKAQEWSGGLQRIDPYGEEEEHAYGGSSCTDGCMVRKSQIVVQFGPKKGTKSSMGSY